VSRAESGISRTLDTHKLTRHEANLDSSYCDVK
jgi:hypothetical protein